MNTERLLEELILRSIIIKMDDEYFITEKYKENIPDKIKLNTNVPKIDRESIFEKPPKKDAWPELIQNTTGRTRTFNLMEACKIPITAPKGYLLRGLNKEAIIVVNNIIETSDISPLTFIDAITYYYAHSDMPKSFKNLLIEGDVLDIYTQYISGALQKLDKSNKTNQQWG